MVDRTVRNCTTCYCLVLVETWEEHLRAQHPDLLPLPVPGPVPARPDAFATIQKFFRTFWIAFVVLTVVVLAAAFAFGIR